AAAHGVIAGQAFDNLNVKAVFSGTRIELERAEMQLGAGRLSASGSYDRTSSDFVADLTGKGVPVPLVLAILQKNATIPDLRGDADFTAKATGAFDRPSTYNVSFDGVVPNVVVNETPLCNIAFKGQTVNQMLTADLTTSLDGRPQSVHGSVNLADENLPFMATTEFNQGPLEPFIGFIPQLR